MKPLLLVAILLVGMASGANASSHGESTYRDLIRPHGHPRSDAIYDAAVNACYQRSGERRTAVYDTPAFKSCMLGKGYRFLHTKVIEDPAPPASERMAAGRGSTGPSVTVSIGGSYSDEDQAAEEEQDEADDAAQAAALQDMQDGIDAGAAAQAAASQQSFDQTEQALGQQ